MPSGMPRFPSLLGRERLRDLVTADGSETEGGDPRLGILKDCRVRQSLWEWAPTGVSACRFPRDKLEYEAAVQPW